jgi:2-C-methyl-D-erythritol 4-phosphate cytidylyltransferase
MRSRYAILVAGGKGRRMGGNVPKQFIMWQGRPVLMHTIDRFALLSNPVKVIVVLPADEHDYWRELAREFAFNTPHDLAVGGEERYHSVANGLELVPSDSIVAIHDGVRPLVSLNLIELCFNEAENYGSAIPVVSIKDSLRRVDPTSGVSTAVARDEYRAVQTPQTFLSTRIKELYRQPWLPEFTDDATVFELGGNAIHLVEGDASNIKLTTPEDLALADVLYKTSGKGVG